jgi:hypothetical protein
VIAYHPDQDPILCAGFIRCGTCGRAAFPVDAEWAGIGLILASYPAPCSHAHGVTMIVDPGGLATAGVDRARYVAGRRCAGLNRRRRPCGAYASPGSDYCIAHEQQITKVV